MQQLYLEDLNIGDRWVSREEQVDIDEIKAFAGSYDPQPYHLDEQHAENTFFGQLVASGWQTAAITMRLMVESIPIATGLIGAGGEISWPKPTYPNDTLRVEAEVVDIKRSKSKPDRGMVTVDIKTLNQHDEAVQLFTCTMMAFCRISGMPPLNKIRFRGNQQ